MVGTLLNLLLQNQMEVKIMLQIDVILQIHMDYVIVLVILKMQVYIVLVLLMVLQKLKTIGNYYGEFIMKIQVNGLLQIGILNLILNGMQIMLVSMEERLKKLFQEILLVNVVQFVQLTNQLQL